MEPEAAIGRPFPPPANPLEYTINWPEYIQKSDWPCFNQDCHSGSDEKVHIYPLNGMTQTDDINTVCLECFQREYHITGREKITYGVEASTDNRIIWAYKSSIFMIVEKAEFSSRIQSARLKRARY